MATVRHIIFLITACTVFGCTRQSTEGPASGGEKVRVPVYISFDGQGSPRASDWEWDDYFPAATEGETKITSLLLIAFRNQVLEEYEYFSEQDITVTDGTIHLGTTEEDALDLEPGPHYFYAMANIPYDFFTERIKPVLDGGTGTLYKDDFERMVIEGVTPQFLTVQSGEPCFFMTNLEPPQIKGIYSEEQIADNPALSNTVSITIGRAAAKASLAYAASETEKGEMQGSLSEIRYTAANNPSAMYLMPVVEDRSLRTPYYSLAFDPARFLPQVKDIEIDGPGWRTATTLGTLSQGVPADYVYCVENNNREPIQGNSTQLLIEAKFTPKTWLNPDGSEGAPSADGTFWRIMQKYISGDDQDYYSDYFNYVPTDDYLAQYYPCEVHEYPQGICYYSFWLRNGEDYTVKRNDFFRMVITHVHSAGSNDKDKTDPGEKVEAEFTRGRVDIRGSHWDEYNEEETLGS